MNSRKVPPPTRHSGRLRSTANATSSASTTTKRDSLAAELERGPSLSRRSFVAYLSRPTDPQLSTAKRQQRAHALNTTLSQAALERKLAAAETTRIQLETRLREREATIERFDADRRWLAEREQEEREEKERVSKEREEEKVCGSTITVSLAMHILGQFYV